MRGALTVFSQKSNPSGDINATLQNFSVDFTFPEVHILIYKLHKLKRILSAGQTPVRMMHVEGF
jgi:hypothetical protein